MCIFWKNKICWGSCLRHYFGMLAEQDLKLCSSQSLSNKFNYRKSKLIHLLCRVDYMAQCIQKLFQWSVKGNTSCEGAENEVLLMHYRSNANGHQCGSRLNDPYRSLPIWNILWFDDLLCTEQNQREMTLVLGLILICYADKILDCL